MATERAQAEARTRVALLERQVALMSGIQFAIHDAIAVRLAQTEASAISRRDLHEFLRGLHDRAPRAYATGLVSLDGQLLASSHEYPATSRVEGRGYMDLIASGESRVIDRIVLEQNGIDALVAASAVTAGTTPAAVVTAWPVEDLARFVGDLAASTGHVASVATADGRLLVDSRGSEPRQLPPDHPLLAGAGSATEGPLTLPDDIRGGASLIARGRIDDTLIVGYEISRDSVRQSWLAGAAGRVANAVEIPWRRNPGM
jgi:hypothetical protein